MIQKNYIILCCTIKQTVPKFSARYFVPDILEEYACLNTVMIKYVNNAYVNGTETMKWLLLKIKD